MYVRQGFNTFTYISQPINLHQKFLESRGHCRPISLQDYCVCCGRVRLYRYVNLKTQIFHQAQGCRLAKEGKKQAEQLGNQNDSVFAIIILIRQGFNFTKADQAPIRINLHGT